MNLALFDFDGTITTKDTFIEFIKHYRGNKSYIIGMASMLPFLLAFKLKLYPNWKAKEKVITYFFEGENIDEFQKKADHFAKTEIPNLVKASALRKIEEHKSKGDAIYIVSASAENWLQKWCNDIDIPLIATKLSVENDKISGKLSGNNCYGPEKVARIKKELNPGDFDEVYAYGDSSGDKEMLELAQHKFYRYFN